MMLVTYSFLFAACSDLPNENEIINSTSHQWIKHPAKNGFAVETNLTTGKMIDGAFTGQKEIVFTLDDKNANKSFGPSGVFNLPLLYSYTVTGIELPDNLELEYVYGAPDGSTENIECGELFVLPGNNTLKVKNAKLSHFSRYGFRPRRI